MSIKLKVDPYCENCPHFEADVDKQTLYLEGYDELGLSYKKEQKTYTYIRCKNQEKCEQIMNYLSNVK